MNDDGESRTAAAHESSRRAAVLRALAGQHDVRSRAAVRSPVVEEALRVFGSERELLLAAHQRWQVSLLARLDHVLERDTDDPHDAVRRAVEELGGVLPGIAALLREHAHDPVLDGARRRLEAYVQQACPCGRRHPLVIVAPGARPPARCAVRRACAVTARWQRRLVRLGAKHGGHRPPAPTVRFS